jgi:hypothetical protein
MNPTPQDNLSYLVCRRCGLALLRRQSSDGQTPCEDCSAQDDVRVWMDVPRWPFEPPWDQTG